MFFLIKYGFSIFFIFNIHCITQYQLVNNKNYIRATDEIILAYKETFKYLYSKLKESYYEEEQFHINKEINNLKNSLKNLMKIIKFINQERDNKKIIYRILILEKCIQSTEIYKNYKENINALKIMERIEENQLKFKSEFIEIIKNYNPEIRERYQTELENYEEMIDIEKIYEKFIKKITDMNLYDSNIINYLNERDKIINYIIEFNIQIDEISELVQYEKGIRSILYPKNIEEFIDEQMKNYDSEEADILNNTLKESGKLLLKLNKISLEEVKNLNQRPEFYKINLEFDKQKFLLDIKKQLTKLDIQIYKICKKNIKSLVFECYHELEKDIEEYLGKDLKKIHKLHKKYRKNKLNWLSKIQFGKITDLKKEMEESIKSSKGKRESSSERSQKFQHIKSNNSKIRIILPAINTKKIN